MSVSINIHQVNQVWTTRSKPDAFANWVSIHCRDNYGQEHEVTYFCRDAALADAIYASLPQGDPTERPGENLALKVNKAIQADPRTFHQVGFDLYKRKFIDYPPEETK